MPLGPKALGRRAKARTREPGDLPRAVVVQPAGVCRMRAGIRVTTSRSRSRGGIALKIFRTAQRLLEPSQENVMHFKSQKENCHSRLSAATAARREGNPTWSDFADLR